MFYINDKVKNKFNDDDYFDGKEYVKKIKEAVKKDDIKSIGVYGKWGIGKTSIIKNAISELIEEKEYNENEIVEYNAWKYNEYDFMRDFLIVCSNKIEGSKAAAEREESYYSDSSEDRQLYIMLWKKLWSFLKRSWRVLVFVFCVYIIGIIAILYVNHLYPQWYDCADLITPITITLISFILPLFLVSEITHKSVSKKFSPEQFARDFEDIVKDKKVLIFIDDIDRCNYEEIKSTFDTLKTFILDENYDVKFIIPVDPNILFNALENQTYDYFSKIIDYPIEIKNYTKVKFEPLKDEILINVEDDYKTIVNDGLYLASKFYIDTPRKMKKFANEFINEIYNYRPEEIIDKGYMFAKLIILKNEFPKYYHNLISNYNTVIEITDDEIINYKSKDYIESSKTKKGIKFDNKLLDFLSKTDNVDLYNFPMYENKISYPEYKIKALCEDPIVKNKFENNIQIDLKHNHKFLDYEIRENIIKPIQNKRFLYSDFLKRICFVITQFRKQKNNQVFNQYFDDIVSNFSYIKEDRNLFTRERKNEKDIEYLNIKYINECLLEYVEYLKENGKDLFEDKLMECILELIAENLEEDFEYIEGDLVVFINRFNNCQKIKNTKFIKIIDKLLDNNFNKYHKEFSWYFELNSTSGDKCYVGNIIKDLENNLELNEQILEQYLLTRYKERKCNTYFKQMLNSADLIVKEPEKYKFIITPLTRILRGNDLSFEDIEQMLSKTKLISKNENVNNLIIKMIIEMKNSSEFDEEKYNDILADIGIEYNNLDPIKYDLKDVIEISSIKEIKIMLGFDNEKNMFKHFNLLKEYGNIFGDRANELLETIINSYCENEGFVIVSDLERHGIDLLKSNDKVIDIINKDLNHTIYLADILSEEGLNKIVFDELDITKIDFEYIESKKIISKISNQIKIILDDCIKKIEKNKDNKDSVKEQIDKFLTYADKLYCNISYNDKTLWTKLKKLDNLIGYCGLIDSYYLPKLKEHKELVQLFFNGKYKDNYLKDNIYSDKIIESIK